MRVVSCSVFVLTFSARVLVRDRYNLNAISHDSAIGLIRMVIARGYNVTEVRALLDFCRLRAEIV